MITSSGLDAPKWIKKRPNIFSSRVKRAIKSGILGKSNFIFLRMFRGRISLSDGSEKMGASAICEMIPILPPQGIVI
jgi:hypothetical protein